MNTNLNKIALDLYGKIQTRFPNIEIGDENGTVLSRKADIPKARFFSFKYEEAGKNLGTISITLDENEGVVLEVSGNLADHKHPGAFNFIRSFRQFAKDRLLNFDVQNTGKDQLDKRDYAFRAKPKEEPVMQQTPMMESKLYGTNRISYQDLGEARLVIKHSQPVNTDLAAGRTMHIESIYVENAQGERFKYPYKHLNGARALAEHLKHGGIPYDAIGKHITSLSEELAQLRKFKGYVSRNETLSESMGDITTKVMERIEEVKKEVQMLQRPAYYEQFAESFEDREEQMIPEEIMSDWIDRLTIRTFNEELRTAFPYIFRLVDESEIPVKELSPEDILGEDEEEFTTHKGGKVEKTKHGIKHTKTDYEENPSTFDDEEDEKLDKSKVNKADRALGVKFKREKKFGASLDLDENQFEAFLDSIVSEDVESAEGHNDLFSKDVARQAQAVDKLKELLAGGLQPGVDGINAALSLKGIIDSEVFTKEYLKGLTDNDDVGTAIKMYLTDLADDKINEPFAPGAQEIAQHIIASKELDNIDSNNPVGGEKIPSAPAPEMPAPAPEMPAPAPDASAMPAATPDMTAPAQPAPVAEGGSMAKLKAKLIKAMECGARLDTKMDFGFKECTIAQAMAECGMDPNEFGTTSEDTNYKEEIIKSISGFWSPQKKNFTIGGTRAKKHAKDAAEELLTDENQEEVERALAEVIQGIDKLDPSESSSELGHIKHLAGVHHNIDEAGDQQEINLDAIIKQLQAIQNNPQAGQQIAQQLQQKFKTDIAPQMQQQMPDQPVQMPGGAGQIDFRKMIDLISNAPISKE
jgi:hypothetical protein